MSKGMSLQDVTFTKTADGKLKMAHYMGKDIGAMDLQGTALRMRFFCSEAVWNKFEHWVTSGDAQGEPDLDKGNKLFAILFYQNYMPNTEWEMDDDDARTGEWDAAVEALLETLQ